MVSVLFLFGCGGGGSGGGGISTQPTLTQYPTLVQSAAFSLPAMDAPPERSAVQGTQTGHVLIAPGATAPSGLVVEWLDASVPASPTLLASTVTKADGSFLLPAVSTSVAAADQWLRVTLADGSVLRAYAIGWVELTPGTEAALREIARLRRAGAFSAHVLTADELGQAQQSLTLSWVGQASTASPSTDADAMVERLRTLAPWNHLLDLFSLPTPNTGAGDIAGLVPVGSVQWPSTVTRGAATSSLTFASTCFQAAGTDTRSCSNQSIDAADLGDSNAVPRTGIGRNPPGTTTAPAALVSDAGELPLLEFPFQVGTRVLYSVSNQAVTVDANLRGSLKVTRRVYPPAPVQALGASVQAVEVVMDFEGTVLDYNNQAQTDFLLREKRWYSPGTGRVRFESLALTRSGSPANIASAAITSAPVTIVANSVGGSFFDAPVLAFAGVIDVQAMGLRHRDAVYCAATNLAYVAVSTGGGQILEVDPDTLATLRTLPTPAVPGRLAISTDGQTLYAGLDGARLVQYRVSDFAVQSTVMLPTDPYGVQYDRVYSLSIDPFDAARVVLIGGSSSVSGQSGAVLVYRSGVLVLRDAPRYYSTDWGWGGYSPNDLAWTSVRDEYLIGEVGSPESIYRLHADEAGGVTTDVSSLLGVNDIGWVDTGGSVLTDAGRTLDAVTFQQSAALALDGHPLTGCHRQTASTDLCAVRDAGGDLPTYVLLDHSTSRFLGTYRPVVSTVTDGCNAGVLGGSFGIQQSTLAATGASRSLVSTLPASQVENCNLEVWKLHGVN